MFKPKPYSIPLEPDSIAIQGQAGSFSHMACMGIFNDAVQLKSCDEFYEAFTMAANGSASLAVIPITNTIAGPVPYVQGLIRNTGLNIVGEYQLPISHCLVTLPGTNLMDVKTVYSHSHALAQCRGYLSRNGWKTEVYPDTAGAAKFVSEADDPSKAAISPALAAHIYGLEVKVPGIQDEKNNVTRFLVHSREPVQYEREKDRTYITTLIAKPKRSEKDTAYQILKILHENNIHRPEEGLAAYPGKDFRNEGFFLELLGHPDERKIKRGLNFLREICSEVKIIGHYPIHHNRFRPRFSDNSHPKVEVS